LISTCEDGLICLYDTTKASEELALENIINVQSPVREAGFFGPQSEAIYCLTGDESLKLYSASSSICRKDSGHQLRNLLSQQMQMHLGTICPIEYLVDCIWDSSSNQLLLLAGSATGNAGVFQVGESDIAPIYHLSGGHEGVVRAWSRQSSSTFLTAGEDARLCEWSSQMIAPASSTLKSKTIVSKGSNVRSIAPGRGGKLRRPRSRMAHTPYG
jgi:WD40 repeat protein